MQPRLRRSRRRTPSVMGCGRRSTHSRRSFGPPTRPRPHWNHASVSSTRRHRAIVQRSVTSSRDSPPLQRAIAHRAPSPSLTREPPRSPPRQRRRMPSSNGRRRPAVIRPLAWSVAPRSRSRGLREQAWTCRGRMACSRSARRASEWRSCGWSAGRPSGPGMRWSFRRSVARGLNRSSMPSPRQPSWSMASRWRPGSTPAHWCCRCNARPSCPSRATCGPRCDCHGPGRSPCTHRMAPRRSSLAVRPQ